MTKILDYITIKNILKRPNWEDKYQQKATGSVPQEGCRQVLGSISDNKVLRHSGQNYIHHPMLNHNGKD